MIFDSQRTVLTHTVLLVASTIDVLVVAWLTVVRVSMAEPEGDGAAISAFEVDVVRAVLVAVLLTRTDDARRALCADQVFFPELFQLLVSVSAVLHPSEVRAFALEAHVVRHFE